MIGLSAFLGTGSHLKEVDRYHFSAIQKLERILRIAYAYQVIIKFLFASF